MNSIQRSAAPPRCLRGPTWRLLALASLGSLTFSSALAQEAGYGYGGLSLGQSRSRLDEASLLNVRLGANRSLTSLERDRTGTGFKALLGYQMSDMWAVEGGYFNLGRFSFGGNTAPPGRLEGQLRAQGINADLVARMPLTQNLSLLARVGGIYARTRDTFDGTGAAQSASSRQSTRGKGYKAGLGLNYAISSTLSVRAEAERYRVYDAGGGRGNGNLISVGLVMPFDSPHNAPRRVEAPMPMPVMAQAEPPRVMPPPAPPVQQVVMAPSPPPPPPPAPTPMRQRVSFSAESLFGFDAAVVRPEGRSALDGFSAQMQGLAFEQVNVEGYTDRLGSQLYNQRLSQQRADAVKAYLVSSGGLVAGKITATGHGESKPVTQPSDCRGTQPSARLIACLQPDRRVEIEVVGTR